MPLVTCLTCKTHHTPASWSKLAWVGIQEAPGTETEPPIRLELRNCACGSTLSIDATDADRAERTSIVDDMHAGLAALAGAR